jgi:hypothetical protein
MSSKFPAEFLSSVYNNVHTLTRYLFHFLNLYPAQMYLYNRMNGHWLGTFIARNISELPSPKYVSHYTPPPSPTSLSALCLSHSWCFKLLILSKSCGQGLFSSAGVVSVPFRAKKSQLKIFYRTGFEARCENGCSEPGRRSRSERELAT